MSLSAQFEFEGSDGSTTITDDSGHAKTVTVSGNCAIRTAASVFGGSSLRLPGASGDHVRIQGGSEMVFPGDFAIHLWFRAETYTGGNAYLMSRTTDPSPDAQIRLFVNLDNSTYVRASEGNIDLHTDNLLGYFAVTDQSGFARSIKLQTFYSIGVNRKGDKMSLFVNGSLVASSKATSVTVDMSDISLGRDAGSNSSYFNGYIDRLLVYKDEYLWEYMYDPYTLVAQDTINSFVRESGVKGAEVSVPSSYGWSKTDSGILVRDMWHGGFGKIEGTTKIDGTPDYAVSREVRLIVERSGLCVRSMWSDPITGEYSFENIDPAEKYTVISYDYEHNFRAVVADNVTPDAM